MEQKKAHGEIVRDDPVAAVQTPDGRGAVAVISVTGDPELTAAGIDNCFTAANQRTILEQPAGRICFGHWAEVTEESSSPEEVVVVRLSESAVEIGSHGGDAAVRRILADLRRQGISSVSWEDQLRTKSTTIDAELQTVLSRSTTRRTALKLLEVQRTLPERIQRLRNLAERILDSPESEDWQLASGQLTEALEDCVKWSDFGLHLTRPWKVVLAGRPNAGKSTLMNALAGFHRAIVFDEPGTTRDIVSTETALDGWPVLLLDTAGIRNATSEIEREGVSRSRQALGEADCICLLLDVTAPVSEADLHLIADVEATGTPSIVLASKSDLDCVWQSSPGETLPISAKSGQGIDRVIDEIVDRLVPEEPSQETAIAVTPRQVDLLAAALQASRSGDIKSVVARLREILQEKRQPPKQLLPES